MLQGAKQMGSDSRDKYYSLGASFTIPAFAKHFGVSAHQVRRAVKLKEIRTVTFAGLERITPAEARRVAELFGLKPCDEADETTKSQKGERP